MQISSGTNRNGLSRVKAGVTVSLVWQSIEAVLYPNTHVHISHNTVISCHANISTYELLEIRVVPRCHLVL